MLSLACWPACAVAGPCRGRTEGADISHAVMQDCRWAPTVQGRLGGRHGASYRPLPTPCRAECVLSSRRPDIPIGPTLLEQSVRQTQGLVFWEVYTLLSTLIEHFNPKSTGTSVPVRVSLCGTVCSPASMYHPRDVFVLANVHWQPFNLPALILQEGSCQTGQVALGGLSMPFTFDDLRSLMTRPCLLASPGQALRRTTGPDAAKLFCDNVGPPSFTGGGAALLH